MRKVLTGFAVGTATTVALFPLYWAIVNSVRPRDVPLDALWLPGVTFSPTLAAWQRMLELPGLWQALGNSVVISGVGASLAVLLAAPAAYAVSRVPFPPGWAAMMLFGMFLLRLLPPVVYLPPYLLLLHQLGLVDTLIGLIIVNATFNLPLAAIILAGAFRDLPREIEEAAWVDGVSRWGSFVRICLPLVAPAIVAAWLLCVAFIWNEQTHRAGMAIPERIFTSLPPRANKPCLQDAK